ncbi:MAG: hypothetical protein QM668_07240 [Agriterribacter sp.]
MCLLKINGSSIQAVLFCFFATAVIAGIACGKKNSAYEQPGVPAPVDTITSKPALSGRLVYHSYSCYDCNDSKLFLYDFHTNSNTVLSKGWNIQNPMNAHFSPDGKKIVFMGITPGTDQWDVFIWKIGDAAQPVNLTAALTNSRNEDPKFSADGLSIIFKSKGKLTRMDTLGNITARYTVPHKEASMPYFAGRDQYILYAAEENGISSIYSYHIADEVVKSLYSAPGIYAYYPVAITDSSFIFTRWHSATNKHDQLYIGYFNTQTPLSLPFNEPTGDYSDAYPVNEQYIFLSGTHSGGRGGYDLYISDITNGSIWTLGEYNVYINTSGNELGACYLK